MYGISTYIWLICMVDVGKYTIHGSSGNGIYQTKKRDIRVYCGWIFCLNDFFLIFLLLKKKAQDVQNKWEQMFGIAVHFGCFRHVI